MQKQGTQPKWKEKSVELTEDLFKNTKWHADDPIRYWDTYFMLPVNVEFLNTLIQSTSEESLLNVKSNLNQLFSACLDHVKQDTSSSNGHDKTRQLHAVDILTCLVRQLFLKKRLSHFNIIQLLTGLDQADAMFSSLVKAMGERLLDPGARPRVLKLAIILSAGNDNVNQNNLNGYFMQCDLSNTLIKILGSEGTARDELLDTVVLWGMLANYNKTEIRNPYSTRLSRCKDSRVLEVLVMLYTQILPSMTRPYMDLKDDEQTVTKSIVSYMTSWFSGPAAASANSPSSTDIDNIETAADLPPYESALFLVLYDLISSNPHFIIVYLQICTQHSEQKQDLNPLAELLSYCSYLFQHNRNPRSFIYTRLTLLMLLCLSENYSVLKYIAKEDSQMTARLCRQRPTPLPLVKKPRSLFCVILDVLVIFLKYNMRKKLSLVTYKIAFSIIHRILLYLKNYSEISLDYHWAELWSTLTATLHFTVTHLDDLKTNEDFETYISSMMNVFNLSINHGEKFLPDVLSYDTLYYEIIRASDDFTALAQHVSHTTTRRSPPDRSPTLAYTDFDNVKLICNHFNPVLEEWQESTGRTFLTPEKVMSVIENNYDTLQLAPMDKVEKYTSYTELPAEMAFFRQVLRTVTTDYVVLLTQRHTN
ncbi:hypothetical protein BDB00DRAFT_816251 [Zychaea mexicana]|uniref:uncharacterized protein n=1 Tax=Zychaea mexicana TaxID=64656 RepID=UPI0022FE25A3|nr:uncharacterized protein BDB00DRAFT_816251 [Zychaea mexicana]KAI9494896.1 hypothetical protein BDB00DRAFT_816251 [Zychaea mexicana]